MNLVIDIGNTLTKLAVFDGNNMIDSKIFGSNKAFDYDQFLAYFKNINHSIVSSVSVIEDKFVALLNKKNTQVLQLNENTLLPFKNKYKTPSTLGKDRIAAIAGAYELYRDKNVLVIDAGTAITFDLINSKNEYLGGNISPGLEMRFKALNHYTARLPLLKPVQNFSLIGQSTSEAIINGVHNGLIFEIQGYIGKLTETYPDLIIITTGGDVQFFETILKKTIFVVSNLTLIGLNAILEYNRQKN
jgi:type III pantothenate kinase